MLLRTRTGRAAMAVPATGSLSEIHRKVDKGDANLEKDTGSGQDP